MVTSSSEARSAASSAIFLSQPQYFPSQTDQIGLGQEGMIWNDPLPTEQSSTLQALPIP